MAAAPDLSQIPPSDIPDALQDGIAKLSAPLKQLLMMKSVPYLIQHRLGSENYVTVEDLADRWDSAQVARQQGPRELGFEADHNGFTAASSGFAAMKLFQVVRAAKEMIQTHPSVLATPGPGPSRPLSLTEVLCDGLFSGGFRSLMHHCLCVAEQKIWCGDFPLSQTRSRKRWMVRAYSSSARCF